MDDFEAEQLAGFVKSMATRRRGELTREEQLERLREKTSAKSRADNGQDDD